MSTEKVSREQFERLRHRSLHDKFESTGNYGSYRSYRLIKLGDREIIRVNEYMSEADGFPYESVDYECE